MDEVVIWSERPIAERLSQCLPAQIHLAEDRTAFEVALRRAKVAFLDGPRLSQVDPERLGVPAVAILDDDLGAAVLLLAGYGYVSHVVGTGLLESSLAPSHMAALLEAIRGGGRDPNALLRGAVKGRVARLTESDNRTSRIERVSRWFESQELGSRTAHQLRDVAEELVTNAFYDAPVAGGFFPEPISRKRRVKLPADRPCEIAYGVCGADLAFVRVQDRFGSFTRDRLLSVLRRCSRTDMRVSIDESMGGAGLGLWRVFSAATFVSITVTPGSRCDLLVALQRRSPAQKARLGRVPFALHLFFDAPPPARTRVDQHDDVPLDRSIVLRV